MPFLWNRKHTVCGLKPLYCSLASTYIGGKGCLSCFPLLSWSQVSVLPPLTISSFPAFMIQLALACLIRTRQRKTKMRALAFFFLLPSTSPQFYFFLWRLLPLLAACLDSPLPHTSAVWRWEIGLIDCWHSHNNWCHMCHDAHSSLPPCLGRTSWIYFLTIYSALMMHLPL